MSNRKIPPRKLAEAILIEQRGCCLYCMLPLDGWIYRGFTSIDLELQWDHMKPYVYLRDNPDDNWAASCQICNAIKNDLHFVSLEEAREHIKERRRELGYSTERVHWKEQIEEEQFIAYSRNSKRMSGTRSPSNPNKFRGEAASNLQKTLWGKWRDDFNPDGLRSEMERLGITANDLAKLLTPNGQPNAIFKMKNQILIWLDGEATPGRNTGFRIIDLLNADPEQVVRNWKDYPAIRKIIRSRIEAV